jgi:tRNA threonylcarbamoyladenosine biosynthesis protein TsaE
MKVTKDELGTLARDVLSKASASKPYGATIIALRGELGAGKTTFTQALARELGITEVVQSPTYVLMKWYPIDFNQFKKLIHIDAYRLERPEEFDALKPETFLSNKENLVVIEWPERVTGQLPTPNVLVNFSHEGVGEEERYIEVV